MKISKNRILRLATCLSLLVSIGHCEDLVITSFDENGTLEWSSDYTNGFYQVQWASTLDGKWHTDFPYDNIQNTNNLMSAQVPRFYRVVWKAGHSVEGSVYYSTSVLTNEPVRLVPRIPDASSEQLTFTDVSGQFRFEGVQNGDYWLQTTSHDGFNGVIISVNTDGENIVQDIRAVKRVYSILPVRDSVLTTTDITFQWETVDEASTHNLWYGTGNDNNYGPKIYIGYDLTTNVYQTTLTLTNGLYRFGVELYDSAGNKVAFGNDFDFTLKIE